MEKGEQRKKWPKKEKAPRYLGAIVPKKSVAKSGLNIKRKMGGHA
jgi:hypothetical protein